MEQQSFKISVSPFSKRNIGTCLLLSFIDSLTSYIGEVWSSPQEAEVRPKKTILFFLRIQDLPSKSERVSSLPSHWILSIGFEFRSDISDFIYQTHFQLSYSFCIFGSIHHGGHSNCLLLSVLLFLNTMSLPHD